MNNINLLNYKVLGSNASNASTMELIKDDDKKIKTIKTTKKSKRSSDDEKIKLSREYAKNRVKDEKIKEQDKLKIEKNKKKQYIKEMKIYDKKLQAYNKAFQKFEEKKKTNKKISFTKIPPVKPTEKVFNNNIIVPKTISKINNNGMIGYLKIHTIRGSGAEGEVAFFNILSTDKNSLIRTIPLNTPHSQQFLIDVLKNQHNHIYLHKLTVNYLNQHAPIESYFKKQYMIINSSNLLTESNIKKFTNISQNNRIQDLFNKKSYVKDTTFIERYNVKGIKNFCEFVKELPFTNYENNDVENYCVYEYVIKRYTKIGKNIIKSIFYKKDGVGINEIKEFTTIYKIPCIIYNIAQKIIYTNKSYTDNNTNHPVFAGLFCNNHFYPHKNIKKANVNYTPVIIDSKYDDEDEDEDMNDSENSIMLEKNGKIFTSRGTRTIEIDNINLDAEMFKGIYPNFKYVAEDELKMKSLLFNNLENKKNNQEFDINKAFYSIAHDIIDPSSVFPIFTSTELYEKYNNEVIDDMYYYLISQNSLENLKQYGFISNSQTGFMINFLIENKLLVISDIEYFKRNSYYGEWSKFINRIDRVAENNIGKLSKEDELNDVLYEKHFEKLKKFKTEYVLYNGTLGRSYNNLDKCIHNIKSTDIDLLNNFETDGEWIADDLDAEYTTFRKFKMTFRYINNCNIYNHIISHCAMFLLKTLFEIKKLNKNCELVKITTDSLSFSNTEKLIFPPLYQQYYKIVKDNDRKNNALIVNQKYFNGSIIISNTLKECDCFNLNKSYTGAPGSGKTYNIKKNHIFDHSASITNVCANNMNSNDDVNIIRATTVYSLLSLFNVENIHANFKKYGNKIIWIDEFSMIQNFMWNYIYILSKVYKTKFIFSGDINQIGPIGEEKINIKSSFFKKLFGDMKILTKDYRNDEFLIILRDDVNNWDINSIESKNKLKNKFLNLSSKKDYTTIKRHLVFTHDVRHCINQQILDTNNYTYKHHFTPLNYEYLEVSPDVILCCTKSYKSKDIYKGDLWQVEYADLEIMRCINLNDRRIGIFNQTYCKFFTVGFATTSHSSQGLTIDAQLGIHEIQNMIQVDKAILYTAITRTTKYSNLQLYNNPGKSYKYDYKNGYTKFEPSRNMLLDGENDDTIKFDEAKFKKVNNSDF